jgi:hypothetical protein
MLDEFAPCGLICGLCKETHKGCKGCRSGGGDQNCYQLNCCKEKGITGCWKCECFPCDKGYLGDEKWKGVIIGFVKCIREDGAEKFYGTVKSRLGNSINYHDHTSKSEQKIIDMLRGRNT